MNLKFSLVFILLVKSISTFDKEKDCKCDGFTKNRTNSDDYRNFVKSRILGGDKATSGELTFVAALIRKINSDGLGLKRAFCSGIILNEYWVLTAANCFVPKEHWNDITVAAGGDHNLNTIINGKEKNEKKIRSWIIHEGYKKFQNIDTATAYNDISLIEIDGAFIFDDHSNVDPACITTEEIKKFGAYKMFIAGYGLTEPGFAKDSEYRFKRDLIWNKNKDLQIVPIEESGENVNCFLHLNCLTFKNKKGGACNDDAG